MDKQKLIFFGPFSTPHTESWSELIDLEKYSLVGISVHSGPSKMPVISYGRGLGKFRFILAILMLSTYCLRYPKALVLSHYYSSYGLASLLSPCQPVIFCWGSDVNVLNTRYPRIGKIVGWLANKRAKIFIVPSVSIKKKLIENGISPAKIRILQYGVDVRRIHSQIKKVHFTDDTVNIASIRNGDVLYQIDKIIDAFKRADFGYKKAILHIFGSGHSLNVNHNDLEARKKIVVHGFLTKDKFYQVMNSCDVFVSIPIRDGLSLSVLEALYLGLKPILSDVGSYKELLSEIDPDLVDANVTAGVLSNLMSKLVCQVFAMGEMQHLSSRARSKDFVRENFSMDNARKDLALILSEVIKGDSNL